MDNRVFSLYSVRSKERGQAVRSFLAVLLGVGTYLGCMATGWFNGVFAAFLATIVYIFVSVFKGFKKKKLGTDLDELAE